MGRIRVDTAVLNVTGGHVRQIGVEMRRLASETTRLQDTVGAAQPQAGRALAEFLDTVTPGLDAFGVVVEDLGSATRQAGAAYAETERSIIPAGSLGTVAGGGP